MFPPRLCVLFAEDACRGILFFIDSYSAGGDGENVISPFGALDVNDYLCKVYMIAAVWWCGCESVTRPLLHCKKPVVTL